MLSDYGKSVRHVPLPLLEFALKRGTWRILFILWFVLLFILSSLPGAPVPSPRLIFSDKIAHAAYFTVGSTAFLLALSPQSRMNYSPAFLLFACVSMAAVVGWFDEWHQSFTPRRDGNSLGDWLANLSGGVLGFYTGRCCQRYINNLTALASRQ
jgi:VanZ family protein